MAEKLQDKHSISPLREMLLHLQRKWKDNLSGCMRTAGSNQIIFPTYCDSEFDLFISVQTNHSIWFSPCTDIQYIRYMPQIGRETEGGGGIRFEGTV